MNKYIDYKSTIEINFYSLEADNVIVFILFDKNKLYDAVMYNLC